MNQTARRNTIIAVCICAAVAIVAAGISIYEYSLARRYKNALYMGYERSLSELNQFVGEIGSNLETELTVGTPVQTVQLATHVSQLTGSAKNTLTNLPLSDYNLEQLEKYFSQTGEYMNVLAKGIVAGKTVNDGQKSAIQSLIDYTKSLKASLDDLSDQYQQQKASFTDIVAKKNFISFEKKLPNVGQLLSDGVSKLTAYSTLDYDGALSDKVIGAKPVYASTLKEVSRDAARKAAAKFLDAELSTLKDDGETNGNVPTYDFATDALTVSISKSGGLPVRLIKNKAGGAEKVSENKALATAADVVSRSGFPDMVPVHTTKAGGILYLNYVYDAGGILCYPDLIEVEVCLNTGTVCAFDSTGYMIYHSLTRTNLTPMPDTNKIKAHLNTAFTILSARPALILNDGKGEVLTVEFDCQTKSGDRYMVFLNAATNAEEKVILLDGTQGGKFLS